MRVFKSLGLAFAMYSKIPMPHIYWSKENMRYTMCFFPLVGAVIGGILMLWFTVCLRLGINNACFAAVAAAIPVLVTGGIHADGFIDTSDALASYGSKQKKLEILSDPHVGAFGIISAVMYYMIYFGFLNEVTIYGETAMIGLGFVMSRALCAIEITLMRTAKNTGLLYEMSSAMNRPVTLAATILMLAACGFVMIVLSPFIGGAVLFLLILMLLYYKFFVAKKIGGITGDTCGYFIQMCELITVIVIVIGGRLA